ncbi:MAG: amidohydrolase [Gemmatimonadales bacterium]
MAAEAIFFGGPIHTQDQDRPSADAVAVANGRITAVGARHEVEAAAGPGTRRVDLGGATLIPGFIDAHAHIWKIGHLLTTMADLRGVASIAALGPVLRHAAARLPTGAWLLGRGYNEARLAERRPPTRHDLDRVTTDRPVALTRTCGHIYACNSVALALAGIDVGTPDPSGGIIDRDASGRPTGLIHETAMGLVMARIPAPTRDDYAAMVPAALRHQLSLGITSTNDAGVAPALLDAYRWMDREDRLPSRVNVMALRKVDGVGVVPLPDRTVSDRLRIDTVKFLADGGLSGATAALSIPYRHADTRGVLRFEDAELDALAGEAHRAGLRLAIHAIGDVTIDQVLGCYERLATGHRGFPPRANGAPALVRPRIEHLGLPSQDQLARAARLGVAAVPQTVFLPALGGNFRAYLPETLLARCYPVRSMLEAGLVVALSSDAPVVENDDPLLGIKAAVDRRDGSGDPIAPHEAISATQALWAYTMGGAIASGDETNRGSITAGKWADFAILDGDPLAVATEHLTTLRVRSTWVGGRLAYESTR